MSDPNLDQIASDLADIKKQLAEKAQAEVTGAIQGVHTKLDGLASSIVADIKAHLSMPRALLAAFVFGMVFGGGAVLWGVHIAKLL